MRTISKKLRTELANDPFYLSCARASEGDCDGRLTWEHALIYAGRQVNARFAIVPLCAYHHAVDEYQDGGDCDKKKNEWIAISRMTEKDRQAFPRFAWAHRLKYLQALYGTYFEPAIEPSGINYPIFVHHE